MDPLAALQGGPEQGQGGRAAGAEAGSPAALQRGPEQGQGGRAAGAEAGSLAALQRGPEQGQGGKAAGAVADYSAATQLSLVQHHYLHCSRELVLELFGYEICFQLF